MRNIIHRILKEEIILLEQRRKWTEDELRAEASKYSTKTDFQKGSPNADASARNKGKEFFDSITSHMIKKKRDKWTDDELESEALKYEYPSDFIKGSTSAYQSALKKGRDFYNKITSHMKTKNIDWTDDMLRDDAMKYKTKPEFMKNSPKAYQTAMNRGDDFWNKITSHMPNLHRTWTDDTLRQEALKYNTPTELYNDNPSAYKLIRDRGDEFFQSATEHMTRLNTWDEESIRKEAKKYKTKGEFLKNNGSAYGAANRLDILDSVTLHMEPSGSRYKRLIYVYEFPDKSAYIGLTYNLDKRDYSHMNNESSAVYLHMKQTGLKPIKKTLTDYMDKKEASKTEGVLEKKYRDEGWTILNRAKTGTLGGDVLIWKPEKIRQLFLQYDNLSQLYDEQPSAIQAAKREGMDFYKDVTSHIARKHNKWTDEMLKDEALKYKTRQEFRDANPKAYGASKNRGDEFYNTITSHMNFQRTQWTDELLRDEAQKYNTRNDFAKQSPNAYTVARRKGDEYFDEITLHMPKLNTSWDLDKLNKEMRKYSTMADFRRESPKAYQNLKYRKLYSMAKDYYDSLTS